MEDQKDASRSLVDPVRLEGRSGYSDLQQIVAFVIILFIAYGMAEGEPMTVGTNEYSAAIVKWSDAGLKML